MSDFEDNASVSDMVQVDPDPDAAISQQSFDPSEGVSRSKTSSMNINGSEEPDKNPDNVNTSFEIIVPKITNPEDYDYLPGRFEAFCILAVDMYEPKLIVRLKSGERTTITAKQLLKLKNGPHVLRDFLDGSQSPDPLSMNLDPKPNLIHTSGDGADDVDNSVTRQIGIARNRQRRLGISGASFTHFFSTRSTRNNEKVVQDYSSSEELENIQSSPAPSTDSEHVRPNRRRHLRRGAQKNKRRRTRESSEESLASEKGTRVSSRLKKAAKYNFKERMEDDEMSEVEVVAPKKKFSGAKEQFVELPEDHPFREAHSSKCFSCERWEDESSREETLVYCQGCTSSYHRECLGTRAARKHLVTKVGADNFILQCSRCLGIKHRDHDILPHLGHCAVCKEAGPMSTPLRDSYTAQEEQQLREENGGIDPTTEVEMSRVNNIDNVLTRCTRCKRAFHIEHILPTPEADRSEIRPEYWHCSDCSNLPDEILPIGVIVAWRPKTEVEVVPGLVELVPEIEKEYLVKWAKKSYFHVVWMPGDWVWCMAHAAMFQTFLKSPKANKPIWTIEEAVPEENLRIDIVFDVEYTREPESMEERANPELVERVFVKFQGLPYEETLWEFPPAQTDVARWEAFKNALADKVFAESIQPPKYKALQERLKAAREKDFEKDLVLKSQPEMVTGGKLMEYQLDGVNWMYYILFRSLLFCRP
ncbi:unnamed protein product [Penicillium olsonii]|nr:unnamed protein product [Penicillium olsonii]